MSPAESSAIGLAPSTGSDARNRDRRADVRYELTDTYGNIVYKTLRIPCKFVDVSLGGCCVKTEGEFDAGALAPVEIVLPMYGMVVRLCGITQWTTRNNLIGVRFIHPSLRTRNELAGLLIGLVDKAAAEVVKEAVASSPMIRSQGLALSKGMAMLPQRTEGWGYAKEALANAKIDAEWEAHERLKGIAEGRGDVEWQEDQKRAVDEQPPEPAADSCEDRPKNEEPPADDPEPAAQGNDRAAAVPGTPSPGTERRVENAGSDDWRASITFLGNDAQVKGTLMDLSLVGCIFRTPGPFLGKIYAHVEVEFQMHGLHFRLAGVAKGIYDKHTAGIGFLEMSKRRREELIQLLDELIEENKRESEGS